MRRRDITLAALIAVAMAGAAAFSAHAYPGSPLAFAVFNSSFVLLSCSAVIGPVSYAYSFLAAFLVLGFWAKFVLHSLSGANYLEPIGAFAGDAAGWDIALWTISAGVAGMLVVRGLHIVASRRASSIAPRAMRGAPSWFRRHRMLIWAASVLAVLGLNGWNYGAAFYQIGVNPKVVLPMHFNVVAAWLVNTGLSIWIAALVHWEITAGDRAASKVLAAPVLEGLAASISTLSRAAYLLHTLLPYVAMLFSARLRQLLRLSRGSSVVVAALLCAGLAASLVGVQLLRVQTYYTSAVVPLNNDAQTNYDYRRGMLSQLGALVVDRWIGLEGVLAVTSHEPRNMSLFLSALRESPKNGADTMYQKIAGATYATKTSFTFLTLPGVFGVLAYAGTPLFVLIGMIVVTALVVVTDAAVARAFGNRFLLSVIAAAMAHVICQINFPYLAVVFFAQLWISLICLYAVSRIGAEPSAAAEPP